MAAKSPKSSSSKAKKRKKNQNLLKLYTEMNKLATDAVDREVTKRFRTIIDTLEEDITKTSLNEILKDPQHADTDVFPESLQPYIKHYVFLSKREMKNRKKQEKSQKGAGPKSKPKARAKTKSKAKSKTKTDSKKKTKK